MSDASFFAASSNGRLVERGHGDEAILAEDGHQARQVSPTKRAELVEVWETIDDLGDLLGEGVGVNHTLVVVHRQGKAALREVLVDDWAQVLATPAKVVGLPLVQWPQ